MNKKILLLTALLVSFGSHAEISKIHKPASMKVKQKAEKKVYTGDRNYLGNDYSLYKGKTLYVMEMEVSKHENGYRDFYTTYKGELSLISDEFRYKPGDHNGTKYGELAGKYFEVLDVLDDSFEGVEHNNVVLKLKNKSNSDILYYHYRGDLKPAILSESYFPFLTVEFYEKLKQQYLGTSVYLTNYINRGRDIDTGREIGEMPGYPVKIVDIAIDEKSYELSFVVEKVSKKKFTIPYDHFMYKDAGKTFYTEEEAERYKKKFGEEYWDDVVSRSLEKGMTKEMVRLINGLPNRINESFTSGVKREQWVYDDQYIYFKGSRLYGYN